MRNILTVVVLAGAVSLSGCGTPAIGTLKSITLTPSSNNLVGEGGTAQLSATGNYSTGSHNDLSNKVTYTVTPTGTDDMSNPLPAPPQDITVNVTGLMTATAPFVCTWQDTNTSGTGAPTWALTGSYQIVASYNGISSQPVFISVASATGNNTTGKCGP